MNLNQYLTETFKYNDVTNKKLLTKIALLADKEENIKLFSHLINCQYKWLAWIYGEQGAAERSWWEPLYELDKLENEWSKSLTAWIDYIASKTEKELSTEIILTASDGVKWAVTPKDIALQLNYHSIHHRAQIQTVLHKEGIKPDFVDYIGTKYRKLG